jgi:Mycobacterium 19 kDa lipoprotein antigen
MTTSPQSTCANAVHRPAGSSRKQRRRHTLAAWAAAFLAPLSLVVALSAPAAAAPSKIVVNGQDITQNKAASPVCADQQNGFHIQGNGLFAVLSSDKTQVQDLDLMSVSQQWGWAPGHPGNVQLTQSGNTYTFTGNIAPSVQGSASGNPVPFEADVTCV